MLVSQTSLVLDDCDSSADHWSGILQKALSYGLSDVLLMTRLEIMCLEEEDHRGKGVVLLTSEPGHVLTVVEVSLDHR